VAFFIGEDVAVGTAFGVTLELAGEIIPLMLGVIDTLVAAFWYIIARLVGLTQR